MLLSFLLFFSIAGTSINKDTLALDTTVVDTLPLYRLGEIFVIAKQPKAQPVPVDELTSIEINHKNASDVAEALKTLGGLDITVGFKGEAALMLQGFQPYQVVVLVDGRPVCNPYYRKTDLSSIPTDDIARITVVKSAISSVTAFNAMGGFINITTEAPLEKPYTRFSASYGSGNTIKGNFKLGRIHKLGDLDKLFYSFGVYFSRSDGFPLPDGFRSIGFDDGGLRDNSDYRKADIHAKIGYRNTGKLEIGLSLGYYNSEHGIPPEEKLNARFWRFPRWERAYADLSFDYRPSVKFRIMGKLYTDCFYNELISYKDRSYDPENIWWDSIHDLKDIGAVVEAVAYLRPKSETRWGLQYRVDFLNRRPDTGMAWLKNRLWTGNLAITHSMNLNRLKIVASLAVPFFSNDFSNTYRALVNPKFAVSFDATDRFNLWGSVARTSRFPTGHELYSQISGNPELRPEHALRFQAGGNANLTGWLSLSGSAFYNSLKDLIERPSRDSLFRNIESAYTAGGELIVSLKPLKNISVKTIYTNTVGENLSQNQILPGIVNHKLTVDFEIVPSENSLVSITYLYESQRFWPDETLEPYSLVNLYTEQKLLPNLRLFISVKNLFDEIYEEEPHFPMPGRRVTVGLRGSI